MRFLFLLLVLAGSLRAEIPPLLTEVAANWEDVRARWAFTQYVREFDGDTVVEERTETYDLSRGEENRWQLVTHNGNPATAEEKAAWSKRKNKVRKREPRPLTEIVDLEHAQVLNEDAHSVSYDIPLRKTAGWIFPGEKVGLTLTINKKSHTVEKGRISIDGPFNIALGLAKVIDLDFDLEVPTKPDGSPVEPAQAQGTAVAVVNKFGRRVEYSWSDFVQKSATPTPPASH